MPFVSPYRTKGELNQVEQWKLDRHPLEVADAVIDTYAEGGAGGHRQGARRGGAAQVGRHLPPAAGGRRLHDAGEGSRRAPHRRAGPGDRAWRPTPSGRAPTDERRCSATATPTSPPARPSRSTGCASRTSPASGGASPRWGSPPSRPAATRPATCCAARCPGSTPTRPSTPCRSPWPSRTSSPATASTPTCPASSRSVVTGCLEDCAQAEINDIGLWPARADDGTLGLQRAGGRRAVRRRADGLRHRRLRRARAGRRGHPGHRPALRRARQPREPGPGPHALPGPGARPRGVPGRAGRPGPLRAAPGRRGAHPPLPGRPRRASTPSARRGSSTWAARCRSAG